jgi:hypothetical protein
MGVVFDPVCFKVDIYDMAIESGREYNRDNPSTPLRMTLHRGF